MKTKILGILWCVMMLCGVNVSAQDLSYTWAKGMGSTGDDYAVNSAIDATGNVYSTGYFSGTVDFDPNAGVFNLTSTGADDIFITKIDANGNLVWAKSIGGTSFDRGQSIRHIS